jgi:hypothetical protein
MLLGGRRVVTGRAGGVAKARRAGAVDRLVSNGELPVPGAQQALLLADGAGGSAHRIRGVPRERSGHCPEATTLVNNFKEQAVASGGWRWRRARRRMRLWREAWRGAWRGPGSRRLPGRLCGVAAGAACGSCLACWTRCRAEDITAVFSCLDRCARLLRPALRSTHSPQWPQWVAAADGRRAAGSPVQQGAAAAVGGSSGRQAGSPVQQAAAAPAAGHRSRTAEPAPAGCGLELSGPASAEGGWFYPWTQQPKAGPAGGSGGGTHQQVRTHRLLASRPVLPLLPPCSPLISLPAELDCAPHHPLLQHPAAAPPR